MKRPKEYTGDYKAQMVALAALRAPANTMVEALPGGHTIVEWDKTWITVTAGNAWDRGQDGWCKCGLHVVIYAHDRTGDDIRISQTGRPCGVRPT